MLPINIQSPQSMQNFQGALHYENLNHFSPKKLEQVAQIFKRKTAKLPDATLRGENKSINGGKPYHYTTFEFDGKDFASLMTVKFRNTFESKTPEQIANILVRLARAAYKENKTKALFEEIEKLKKSHDQYLERAQNHIKQKRRKDFIKMCEARAAKIARKINKLEAKYERRKPVIKPIVGAKNWIYE